MLSSLLQFNDLHTFQCYNSYLYILAYKNFSGTAYKVSLVTVVLLHQQALIFRQSLTVNRVNSLSGDGNSTFLHTKREEQRSAEDASKKQTKKNEQHLSIYQKLLQINCNLPGAICGIISRRSQDPMAFTAAAATATWAAAYQNLLMPY